MSKNLLKEAIADAKAVRSTAIANAKLALEEAFTPKLQSMLSQKIAEEMDDELEEEDTYQWRVDKAQARYINERKSNNGLVFSQNNHDLASVEEATLLLVDKRYEVASFDLTNPNLAMLSMSELERFRNKKETVHSCPICGHCENGLIGKCSNTLLEVTLELELEPGVPITQRQYRFLVERERVRNFNGDYRELIPGRRLVVDFRPGVYVPRDPDFFTEQQKLKCEKLAFRRQHQSADWYFGPLTSRFLPNDPSHVIVKLVKFSPCHKFHSKNWYNGVNLSHMEYEQRESSCPLLFLYNQAEGLDL